MRRTPGTPAEKLVLLRGIDETSLPHLVADILYFCRSHRRVTVVDGPGDGRRDVSSTTPDGTAHLAQCKFHGDVTTAVGARETDELPVALLKFGCKSGLFVTTARLSPQSKRESVVHAVPRTCRRWAFEVLPQVTSTICGRTEPLYELCEVRVLGHDQNTGSARGMKDVQIRRALQRKLADAEALDSEVRPRPGAECGRQLVV
jgi:hypothetical protein